MARKKSKGGMTKAEAVRQTLAKLGNDVKPNDIVNHVKSAFGLEMSYDMASTYKSAALKKAGGKRRGRKPGRKPAVAATNGRRAGGSISMADIQAVKDLADRLGADKVRQLAEVLAR